MKIKSIVILSIGIYLFLFWMTACKTPVAPEVTQHKNDSLYAVYTGTGTIADAKPSTFSPHTCHIGDTITIFLKDFKLGSLQPKVWMGGVATELPIVTFTQEIEKNQCKKKEQ